MVTVVQSLVRFYFSMENMPTFALKKLAVILVISNIHTSKVIFTLVVNTVQVCWRNLDTGANCKLPAVTHNTSSFSSINLATMAMREIETLISPGLYGAFKDAVRF